MKKPSAILVTALAAVGINFAASAEVNPDTGVDLGVIKTNLKLDSVEGISNLQLDEAKGEISYKDGDDKVVIFAGTKNQHTLDVVFGVTSIRYLAVAGGGSGGGQAGGGGGAGGMLGGTPESTFTVKPGDKLLINVGAGGQRVSNGNVGKNGFDSAISNDTENVQTQILLAYGGGGGGCYNGSKASAGLEGGSGGGGSSSAVGGNAKDDSAQGHKGGDVKSGSTTKAGAGGGGASEDGAASGSHYDSPRPGKGGIGRKSDITGKEVGYAGGGNGGIAAGGATYLPDSNAAYGGGQGGRKTAGYYDGNPGTDGLGGGGGGAASQSGYSSGKGGDGIVILRFVATPDTVKATFNYDSEKCTVTANGKSLEGALEYDAPYYAELKVVVTPIVGYKYESAPTGWTLTDGSITRTYPKEEVVEDFAVEFDAPVEDQDVGERVDVEVNKAEHATYEATVDGKPIVGNQVEKDSVVVVIATPEEHYAYAELPADWERVSDTTAITRSYTASEDLTITIPAPTPIIVTVTVQLIDNVACVVKDGETIVPSGTEVQEGTELKVTVTPQGIYEYSAAPGGWTKNDDGTITLDLTATEETAAIVVPAENFGKRQVTVSFVARGVAYAATNVATKVEVKSGVKLDADVQLEIVATRYSNEYIFADTLPAGWEKVDANVIKGVVAAASSIEIPVATWAPTNGELIENGGFELFDKSEFVEKAGFPASMVGSWVGYQNTTFLSYKYYGLSKTSPHSGTYSAWSAGNQANNPYIGVSFTTPAETRAKTEFKLCYYIRHTGTPVNGECALGLYQNGARVEHLETVTPTTAWEERTLIITGLSPSTTYELRFGRNGGEYHYYAIDDVSLKMRKNGLAFMIY